jgi:hypothetical protein
VRIVSWDPGHWTGWAILELDKEVTVISVGQFYFQEYPSQVSALSSLSTSLGVGIWLVEEVPDNQPDPTTRKLVEYIISSGKEIGMEVRTLKPVKWKVLAKVLPNNNLNFTHAKEAMLMGMIFLQRLF